MRLRNLLQHIQLFSQRINLHTAFPETVTNMWSGCEACGSNITDYLSLADAHAIANAFCKTAHMEILRFVYSVVADLYIVSMGLDVIYFFYFERV